MNLNQLKIECRDSHLDDYVNNFREDFVEYSSCDDITAYFNNLENYLIENINKYPVVVGCVAWLTNENILKALSTKERVSIIVQKEDFLRPDCSNWSKNKLRKLYKSLPPGVKNWSIDVAHWGLLIDKLAYNSCWETEAIRWAGNFNTDKNPAFPRMHNKFLVFCDIDNLIPNNLKRMLHYEADKTKCIIPKAVWTGSFNMTHNATMSLENAVLIKNQKIVRAYYNEWQHIFGLSESINDVDWKNGWWCPPDKLYVGT